MFKKYNDWVNSLSAPVAQMIGLGEGALLFGVIAAIVHYLF